MNIIVKSAGNILPPVPTYQDTGKHTNPLVLKMQNLVIFATRNMLAYQLFQCIFLLIVLNINVRYVGKASQDPGCCKDTCGHTQEKNLLDVLIVERSLETVRT